MKKKRRYVDRLTQLTRPNPVSILLLACQIGRAHV